MLPSNPRKRLITIHDPSLYDGEDNKDDNGHQPAKRAKASISLLDLNDDLLDKIFDRLSKFDLCSMVQTCSRLNGCATLFFARKHKKVTVDINFRSTIGPARRLFSSFGSVILELRIFGSYSRSTSTESSRIIDAVIRHCTSLKALTLVSYNIPDNQNDITKMGLLFKNLKKLHLLGVTMLTDTDEIPYGWDSFVTPNGNVFDCFSNCQSLIDLTVEDCYEFKRIISESNFPKLQRLKYCLCEGNVSCHLDGFFMRHKNLKSFSLESGNQDNFIADIPALAASCERLKTLKLALSRDFTGEPAQHRNDSLKSLDRLQNLRELKVYLADCPMIHLIKVLPALSDSLEELELSYSYEGNDKLIEAVAQLRNLRIFRLFDCYGLGDINPISGLKKLTTLSFRDVEAKHFDLITIVDGSVSLTKIDFFVNFYKITKETYRRLVEIVLCRATNQFLKLRCPPVEQFNDCLHAAVKFN